MIRFIRRLIIWLYWNYGFKHDNPAASLVCYYLVAIKDSGIKTNGDIVISELNDKLNKVVEVSFKNFFKTLPHNSKDLIINSNVSVVDSEND